MCGIYGYSGRSSAVAETIRGLKNLEYRGYDSCGLAARNGRGIEFWKRVGKISEIRESDLPSQKCNIAIGHTRWATHGGVTKINAHPHWNSRKDIAVVHNGIIENHLELRRRLEDFGIKFISQTDTEVIAHLIDWHIRKGGDFREAVFQASRELKGRFAFAALHDASSLVIGVRRGSPLVYGRSETGHHLASDEGAFPSAVTAKVFLNEGGAVCLDPDSEPVFYDFRSGKKVSRPFEPHVFGGTEESKDGFEHHMLKEIMEQRTVLMETLAAAGNNIRKACRLINRAKKIFLTGCGTAGKMCMAGQYFFANSGRRVDFVPASEFARLEPFVDKKSVVICVSQSGETADVLEAVAAARKRKARLISILNAENSTLARMSDITLPLRVGRERAVAATKTAAAQLLLLLAIAGDGHNVRTLRNKVRTLSPLFAVPYLRHMERLAKRIALSQDVYLIGRGSLFPIATEGALKIQEVSYIHADGFAAGELKHGPIALITRGNPCIALIAKDAHRADMLSNCAELKARGGWIIGIGPRKEAVFDVWVKVPEVGEAAPVAALIPLQLLAYYSAVFRKVNPDMPRNLAKSVTVK